MSVLSKWTSVEDREFLFPNQQLIGTFLTTHPFFVFLALSVGCSAILFLPAWGLNLLSISVHYIPGMACTNVSGTTYANWDFPASPQLRDVGFLHKWNWSLGHSVAIPLIFALAAAACRSIQRSLAQLVSEGTVQPDKCNPNGAPTDFIEKIARGMLRWDRAIFWGSAIVALMACLAAANLASPKSNLRDYAQIFASGDLTPKTLALWYDPCRWDDIDWMHGWTISGHHGSESYVIGNFVFYLIAEVVQGFVIFLACYFVLKFLTLTQSFATVIIEDGSGFHFEPFISDPERCLGLRPIGRLFSMFLLLSIVFQIFAFGLRLQKLLPNQGVSLLSYPYSVGSALHDLTTATNANTTTNAMDILIRLAGFRNLDAGLVVILILMVVPMAVIAWWPIVRVRNYVSAVRRKELQEFRIEEQRARQTQQYDKAKHIADDMEKLTKSSIWPNGFKVGWGSFFFLFALLVSTIVPPLIVPLVGGGVGLKILKKITSD
jgi:hypothetical protein